MEIMINPGFLLHTLQDLVHINSINPSLVPGQKGESEIATYISESLRNLGLDVNLLESSRGRPSVVGTLPGRGGGKSLMLNAHIDTVGVAGMAEPFSATVKDGKLFGRGAYDMKGSVAAILSAAKALVDNKIELSGDLILTLVADEEHESLGTQEIIKHYQADAAIVTEPTQLQICLAHKGFIWLQVETLGRAAHGSRFEEGIDANMRMGHFLAELSKLEKSLRSRAGHSLVGPPSLHAATIHGGSGFSTYADKCTLIIERRTIPGETEKAILKEIQTLIDRLSARDSSFKAILKIFCVREPFEISQEAEIVQVLSQTAGKILEHPPGFMGDTPWMDSALLSAAGIETVVMGPSGAGAHSHEEWVNIGSVEKLAAILARTAVDYCG